MKTDFVTVSLWCTSMGPCITLDVTGHNLQPVQPIRYPITRNESVLWARWANDAKLRTGAVCALIDDGWTLAVPIGNMPQAKTPPHPRFSVHRKSTLDYDLFVSLNSLPLFKSPEA